ncbi:hypothetical protein LIER_30576 [Lithospermum erythrorhizon]|uniref:Uncharacterized protein n=1 Tax=Lithospermum erythrorhizon TaxID=34254 RepID=A0AAV3RN36_LITER
MPGDPSEEIPPNSTALASMSSQQNAIPLGRPDSPVTRFLVAHVVASGFNDAEIDENQQESDAISAKPVSVHPPSSSTADSPQVRLTPPTSQSTGSSQAGESADKPGDTPTIIRDSLPVSFSDENLTNFGRYLSIPSFVEMRLPL